MTYEQALQIAMEELDEKIKVLSDTFQGHSARIETYIYDLSMARKALMQELQKVGESYDQTELELCERCGWKTVVPDDGCLNCNRREWVGLTQEELQDAAAKSYFKDGAGEAHFARGYFAYAIEAKLKEKNA